MQQLCKLFSPRDFILEQADIVDVEHHPEVEVRVLGEFVQLLL